MKSNFLNWLSECPQLKEPMIIYDSKVECGSKLFTEEFSKSQQERNAFSFGMSCPSVMRSSKTEQYENYRLSGGTLTFEEYFFSQHPKEVPGVNEELPCTLNSELQNFFERNSEKFDITRIEVFTSENDEKPKVRVSKVKRYTDNQGISHLKIR